MIGSRRTLLSAALLLAITIPIITARGSAMASSAPADVSRNRAWMRRAFGMRTEPEDLPFSLRIGRHLLAESASLWRRKVHEERPDPSCLRRTLTLTDPATDLEVRAVANVYEDTPGVDWTLYLTNRGQVRYGTDL